MPEQIEDVITVVDARAGLTGTLHRFRQDADSAEPVVFGSHRRAEAVIIPIGQYQRLISSAGESSSGSVRAAIRAHRSLIERLAVMNRLVDVQLFGSVARGDDTAASDVDLLVEPGPDASLFDLAQFELDVESVLGRPVDAVSRRALDAERDAAILAEAQPL